MAKRNVGGGKVIKAASLSAADVQAALDQALDGDTVQLPAGTATWAANVKLNEKALTLRGAGIDQTVIRDGTPSPGKGSWDAGKPLQIIGAEGQPWRLTGITFRGQAEGNPDEPVANTHLVFVGGTCKNWRIDHCAFLEAVMSLRISGYTYGLIDHCDFRDTLEHNEPVFGIWVECDRKAPLSRPLTLGTAEAVYVEDCVFDLRQNSHGRNFGPLHAEEGARLVFRRCRNNGMLECAQRMVNFEVYDNFFGGNAGGGANGPLSICGGTGVVFNNRFQSGVFAITAMYLRCYRTIGAYMVYIPGLAPHKSRCDGGSLIDGNLPYDSTATGRHTGGAKVATLTCSGAHWTPGRWVGFYLWNVTGNSRGKISANTANTVTAALEPINVFDQVVAFPEPPNARYAWEPGDVFKITNGYPQLNQPGRAPGTEEVRGFKVQKSAPIYEWNNLLDGTTKLHFELRDPKESSEYLKEGRDFISDTPKLGYQPFQYPHPLQNIGD